MTTHNKNQRSGIIFSQHIVLLFENTYFWRSIGVRHFWWRRPTIWIIWSPTPIRICCRWCRLKHHYWPHIRIESYSWSKIIRKMDSSTSEITRMLACNLKTTVTWTDPSSPVITSIILGRSMTFASLWPCSTIPTIQAWWPSCFRNSAQNFAA